MGHSVGHRSKREAGRSVQTVSLSVTVSFVTVVVFSVVAEHTGSGSYVGLGICTMTHMATARRISVQAKRSVPGIAIENGMASSIPLHVAVPVTEPPVTPSLTVISPFCTGGSPWSLGMNGS
jgi:hypothetical protein